jgi:hypothetical protein
MIELPDKKGLDDLIKDVPSSSITPDKIPEKIEHKQLDINSILKNEWGDISNSLLSDYSFGESFAKFGESKLTITAFFSRLSDAIINIIFNEHHKRHLGSEDLKLYCDNLELSFKILAKELEKKELPSLDAFPIISSLQGFLANYIKNKPIKKVIYD